MEINDIKNVSYLWFDLLTGRKPSPEQLKMLEKFFGPFDGEVTEEHWIKIHSVVKNMWIYKKSDWRQRISFKIGGIYDCPNEQCPIRKISYDLDEPNIYNLVVGPHGHLSSGESKDFIKVILERLSITGNVTEAYYHDPYIKEPFAQSFTEIFLKELCTHISSLVVVTSKTITTNNASMTIKKIPEDQIHDRFVIVYEDGSWKGVSVGGSLNRFPSALNGNTQKSKHFIISKLEEGDAAILADVIKACP
jgi:hypothetical protein